MVTHLRILTIWMGLIVGIGLSLTSCSLSTEDGTRLTETPHRAASTSNTEAVDTFITNQMAALNIPGLSLAVIENGKISYVQAYGLADREVKRPVTRATLFETASLSKPVFAYFAMMQIDKGVITLDDPLSTYLPHPEINDPRANEITARMVLSHQSGFPNWRWENEGGALDIKFDPGTQFSYSGEGFEYLALVLAHELNLSLKDLPDRIAEDLMRPLGIQDAYWVWNEALAEAVATGYSDHDPKAPWKTEKLIASASLHTSAENYARILLALLDGHGLTDASQKDMLTRQIALSDEDAFKQDFGLDAWGLGIALKSTSHGQAVTHGGVNDGFTAWATVLKDTQTGYVFLTNSESGPELNKLLEPWLLTHLQQ